MNTEIREALISFAAANKHGELERYQIMQIIGMMILEDHDRFMDALPGSGGMIFAAHSLGKGLAERVLGYEAVVCAGIETTVYVAWKDEIIEAYNSLFDTPDADEIKADDDRERSRDMNAEMSR